MIYNNTEEPRGGDRMLQRGRILWGQQAKGYTRFMEILHELRNLNYRFAMGWWWWWLYGGW